GPQTISPQAHGAILERLLKSMYQAETGDDRDNAIHLLKRYIYAFCIDKIFRRFHSKIPEFSTSYISLFLRGTDGITLDDYRAHCEKDVVLPKRLASRDESILHTILQRRYPGHDFTLSNTQPQKLILEVDDQWIIWTCFKDFLKQARDSIDHLRALKRERGKIKEDAILSALEHLDRLSSAMSIIFCFARLSPSFWTIMERMAPLLQSRLVGVVLTNNPVTLKHRANKIFLILVRLFIHGWDAAKHSPTSAEPANPEDHTASPRSSVTVDSESSDLSDEDDATSDVEMTRSSRTAEQPEDLHDIISRNWSKCTILTRHWMKSITQWHHGLEDLSAGQKKLGILSGRLTIDVTVAPLSLLPRQQAPLTDIIESIFPKSDTKEMLDILRANATSLCLNGAKEELLQTLSDQNLTDEAIEEIWSSGFRGGIHCEAQLAYKILQKSPSGHKCLIGISKRCCFCCAELLKVLQVNDGDIVEHGKIYSWTPPSEASDDEKQAVLKKLQEKFKSYLEGHYQQRHKTPDSGSSNDSDDTFGYGLLRAEAAKMVPAGSK
ncbi:hypothetical protein FRC00_007920, partial [Tulasnella sp. 408]